MMYDSDESVTDHICLTQNQKGKKKQRGREEPSKKDIQRMHIWLRRGGPFRSSTAAESFQEGYLGEGGRERRGEERERGLD
jgi:hypothetical protein